jgi:lipopolysaccharide transport system permease protein
MRRYVDYILAPGWTNVCGCSYRIDGKRTSRILRLGDPAPVGLDWNQLEGNDSHRELLFYLIWRDISVRYKQTVLGPAWAILQPLTLMLIFTVIFGRFVKIDSEGFEYPVFVFAGLIPWTLFSQGMAQSSLSLVSQHQLLTKVYFPRLFVPIAAAWYGAACV